MQAHKLSSYNTQLLSNTQLSNSNVDSGTHGHAERKVELVQGKPMLKTVMSEPKQNDGAQDVASSKDTVGQFNFAGLAG